MITVSLPVYASEIAWLAMESLCNQKTFHAWELIIYEDEQHPLGKEFYSQYEQRLIAAGCEKLIYKYSHERISLSIKWRAIARMSDSKSVGMILQAADNYSEPNRIETAANVLIAGFDWMYSPKVIFYDIHNQKTMLYDLEDADIGSDMAISRKIAVRLPDEIKWASVDTWLFESVQKIKPFAKIFQDRSDNWKKGIATDGNNRISKHRRKFFNNPKPPFYDTKIKPSDCIPVELINRLSEWSKSTY